MRPYPIRSCWSKLKYPTREAAHLATIENEAKFKIGFTIYECGDRRDRHFHITKRGS